MEKDWLKIATAVLGGALSGIGLYAGYLNINWSQLFGG